MRYYLIAGEASGDLHGSGLVRALHAQDPEAEIRCWGGEKMEAAGAVLVKHYRDLAFMGFTEVIRHLPTILSNIKFCKADITEFKPNVVVFIDYPGFNLRIAEWAHGSGFKTAYYISPQAWAWKENRVKAIRRNVDRMLVILPFEEAFYKKWNYPVTFVGHPLVEAIQQYKSTHPVPEPPQRPVIALLPGSREQEIRKKLPVMLSVVPHFPDHDFVIAQAPAQPASLYAGLCGNRQLRLEPDAYRLLSVASAALVTSGTATLETALFQVPEVVCYIGSPVSYWLAKKLIRVNYISLVNLILDKPVVKELIQEALNENNLVQELRRILKEGPARNELLSDYRKLWDALGSKSASQQAAREIVLLGRNK